MPGIAPSAPSDKGSCQQGGAQSSSSFPTFLFGRGDLDLTGSVPCRRHRSFAVMRYLQFLLDRIIQIPLT